MAGDPACIGCTPVDIIVMQVKDPRSGECDLCQIAAGGVNQALGFTCCSRRVENKEWVLRLNRYSIDSSIMIWNASEIMIWNASDLIMPPYVAPFLHCYI